MCVYKGIVSVCVCVYTIASDRQFTILTDSELLSLSVRLLVNLEIF